MQILLVRDKTDKTIQLVHTQHYTHRIIISSWIIVRSCMYGQQYVCVSVCLYVEWVMSPHITMPCLKFTSEFKIQNQTNNRSNQSYIPGWHNKTVPVQCSATNGKMSRMMIPACNSTLFLSPRAPVVSRGGDCAAICTDILSVLWIAIGHIAKNKLKVASVYNIVLYIN